MTRIDDTRIENLQQADQTMAVINTRMARMAKVQAVADSKIATIKEKLANDLATYEPGLKTLTEQLGSFIKANLGLFKKPKKRKTAAGEYGLQAASELVIDDEEELVAWLKKKKLNDCVKITEKPVKSEITKLLKAKNQIPGCTLKAGDTVVIKPDPETIREAKEN